MAPTFCADGGGSEDGADQAAVSTSSISKRLPVRVCGPGQVAPRMGDVAEHPEQEEPRKRGSGSWTTT